MEEGKSKVDGEPGDAGAGSRWEMSKEFTLGLIVACGMLGVAVKILDFYLR